MSQPPSPSATGAKAYAEVCAQLGAAIGEVIKLTCLLEDRDEEIRYLRSLVPADPAPEG
jgi:hypothetical protein